MVSSYIEEMLEKGILNTDSVIIVQGGAMLQISATSRGSIRQAFENEPIGWYAI